MHNETIMIEVAYALPATQSLLTLEVRVGATIRHAILQSGILRLFPEIDPQTISVGIFSEPKELDDIVKEGDRIEIYRPLTMDPKEARRRRAGHAR